MPRPFNKMLTELSGWKAGAVVVVGGSLLFEWYGRTCGFLLTSDSQHYLSAARSFQNSFQLLGYDDLPITYWPPLFPVILSFFAQPLVALVWVNLFIKLALFFLLGTIARKIISSDKVVLAYLLFVFCGVHLTLISVFVWSELIFVLLLSIFLLCLMKRHHSSAFLLLAFLSGFLLCIQRNAGLFIIAGASVWMFLERPSAQAFLRSILFFMLTTTGFWTWNLYASYVVPSDFRIYDHDYGVHFLHNLQFLAESWGRAFVPIGGGIFFTSLLLLIGLVLRKEFHNPVLRLLAWICLMYLIGLSLMFRLDVHDGDRYIAVILPFFLLLVFFALAIAVQNTSIPKFWLTVALLLAFTYPTARTVKNVIQWHEMSCSLANDELVFTDDWFIFATSNQKQIQVCLNMM